MRPSSVHFGTDLNEPVRVDPKGRHGGGDVTVAREPMWRMRSRPHCGDEHQAPPLEHLDPSDTLDGWGPDNMDRVFAHETGHIFNCPDDYASSGCGCGGSWGAVPTSQRQLRQLRRRAGGVACLMRANDFQLCEYTEAHLG
jgi:hypothetical protein